MKAAVTLRESQLGALFRAFIKVDRCFFVVAAGPFFLSRETAVVPGAALAELFTLRHDRDDEQAPALCEAIAAMADTPERLEIFCRTKNIRLAGITFSTEDGGFLLALNIVPEDFIIEGQGLTISDFSQIDASVPALTLIGMQRALLAEAREAAIDLAKAQSQAMDLLERTQRLGRYIVHDLTNYLSIIRLNVANLARSAGNAETSRAAIEAATRHVGDLVLSLERLTGHRDVEVTPIPVDQTIRSNLAFIAASLPADFTLDFIGGAAQAAVRAGRTELITMLTNVIVQARAAMVEGGAITISTYCSSEKLPTMGASADERWIVIRILHDGPGFDEDTVRLMLDPTMSVQHDGPDFPLRSVRTWARSAGGDVRIAPLPGVGTDICIHLPVSDLSEEPELAVAPLPRRAEPHTGANRRVLVVEDEIHALDAMIEILRLEGYAATPASNAAEAMDALHADQFDILLTDVVMPERSGVELANEVEARHPGMGIILMSGYLPDESQLQPHWHMLRKPIDLRLLSKTLAAT
ncbi:hypothetical protein AQZ52_10775 [Novosphingobium fuchskuhlense]|uniref:Response regulatory domain-containing protein n=1 Tax=Novosphingobium fuchskuhlense TaxID=1117702 RepID=A0A124JUE3_9SPHN|nr:response regulator [Novosphingobium fuchskuhlense]KUR71147.1 hypothetical protein AQZ52_10775 [Novosphingobium fuchskuhlense]